MTDQPWHTLLPGIARKKRMHGSYSELRIPGIFGKAAVTAALETDRFRALSGTVPDK